MIKFSLQRVSSRLDLKQDETISQVAVCGVTLMNCTMSDAVNLILGRLSERRRQTIFFANAHGLYMAMRDAGYCAVLNAADAVFADGTGVRRAARWQGVRLRDNVNGTDLLPLLLSSRLGLRVFLVGGRPERVRALEQGFRAKFPRCHLVGARHGYFSQDASQSLVEEINDAKPEILLVGMGNPLQEAWISENAQALRNLCIIAVGGLFQYWTGDLVRAPRWMRRLGIEWAHIVICQPHKMYRYFILGPLFLLRALYWKAGPPS